MAYKRYFYRNGNKFGPYYYESYRDETGKVRKRYVGTQAPVKITKTRRRLITPTTLFIFLVVLLLISSLGVLVYRQKITGKLLFLQEESLLIKIKKGELLPINSKLVVNQNNTVSEFLLSELVESNAEGAFYIENKEINGEGKGYGVEGEKVTYPVINFKLKIISGEAEAGSGEEAIESSLSEKETSERKEEAATESSLSEKETSERKEEAVDEPAITGEAVLEQEIEGQVSKEKPFTYNIDSENYKAEITEVDKASADDLKIEKGSGVLTITTDYSEIEKGFGKDYLTDEETYIEVSFSDLGIAEGNLTLALVYQDTPLAKVAKEIFDGENISLPEEQANITGLNETILNITELNETTLNITETNETLSITTKQYKAVINRPVKWIKVINLNASEVRENLTIELPKGAENISVKTGKEVQQALKESEEYEQIINKADREELVAGRITGDVSLEIKKSRGILIRFWKWMIKITITGKVIQEEEIAEKITEKEGSREIRLDELISSTEEDVAVEYYTESPQSFENEISETKKQIIISAPSELNYTDILAYTELPKEAAASAVKLYHITNETSRSREEVNITKYDLNANNLTDYIEWIVPHLSNQTYELIIEISKAEHLDENRSFISDIYEQVKALDGNWSEVINNNEYVRATFEQNLTNKNDITIYARMSNCSANSVNNSVIINGAEVPCDIYQKKKRIEEIRGLLEE